MDQDHCKNVHGMLRETAADIVASARRTCEESTRLRDEARIRLEEAKIRTEKARAGLESVRRARVRRSRTTWTRSRPVASMAPNARCTHSPLEEGEP